MSIFDHFLVHVSYEKEKREINEDQSNRVRLFLICEVMRVKKVGTENGNDCPTFASFCFLVLITLNV